MYSVLFSLHLSQADFRPQVFSFKRADSLFLYCNGSHIVLPLVYAGITINKRMDYQRGKEAVSHLSFQR